MKKVLITTLVGFSFIAASLPASQPAQTTVPNSPVVSKVFAGRDEGVMRITLYTPTVAVIGKGMLVEAKLYWNDIDLVTWSDETKGFRIWISHEGKDVPLKERGKELWKPHIEVSNPSSPVLKKGTEMSATIDVFDYFDIRDPGDYEMSLSWHDAGDQANHVIWKTPPITIHFANP